MKAKRLLKVAAMIETINPALLEMEEWGSECGTKHCVIGFAAHLGLFKGLKLVPSVCATPNLIYSPKDSVELENWPAVYELFDLNDHDAGYLFGQNLTLTPLELATRIRKYVADNKPQPDVPC